MSLDVSSLYTNIPNDLGTDATYQALLKHRGLVNNMSNSQVEVTLVELLSLVLTLNNFKFNDEHNLQIGGMAIGTRLAPSFASIYMDFFEEKHVWSNPTKWTYLGAVSATVGVTLLHIITNISN